MIEKQRKKGAKEIEIEHSKRYLNWLTDYSTTELSNQIKVIEKVKVANTV